MSDTIFINLSDGSFSEITMDNLELLHDYIYTTTNACKSDEHIPDDKKKAYELGYLDALTDLASYFE